MSSNTGFGGVAGIQTIDQLTFWGPVALGAMFACLLQGYVFAMGVGYFRRYASQDGWGVRGTIILILLLSAGETGLAMTKSMFQNVIHAGDAIYLLFLSSHPDEYLIVLFTNFTIITCQAFLCWRCIRFSRAMDVTYRSWVRYSTTGLAVIMTVLLVLSGVGTVIHTIRFTQASNLIAALASPSQDGLAFWFYWNFTISVIVDILIVVGTTVGHRAARTGFSESTKILDVIVNLTLRNGAAVLAAQIVQLVLFVSSTNTSWVLFPHSIISRVYAITVLSILTEPRDARQNFRRRQDDAEGAMYQSNPPFTASHGEHPRDSVSQGPSQTSIKCISCGSSTLGGKGSVYSRAGLGTPRLGQRSSGVVGVGELGVTIQPRVNGFSETEGPVSFAAALFGLEEEQSEDRGSPKIGVDTPGSGSMAEKSENGFGFGTEKEDDHVEDQLAERYEGLNISVAGAQVEAVPVLARESI